MMHFDLQLFTSGDAEGEPITDLEEGKIEYVPLAIFNQAVARIDALAETQVATLERLAKLEPVAALETEGEGVNAAITPGSPAEVDELTPPAAVSSEDTSSSSPLRKLHDFFG